MNTLQPEQVQARQAQYYRPLLIANGSLVLLIGLIAGFMLQFSVIESITLWPPFDFYISVPGTTRGWIAAHLGGITNGVLLMVVGLTIVHIKMSSLASRFVVYSIIWTGWGNTLFYWFGNFSSSRGLAPLNSTDGSIDIAGLIAYVAAGSAMFFTIFAISTICIKAFKEMKKYSA